MNRAARPLLAAVALVSGLTVTACEKPVPATPALWEVTGPHGQQGWLFGTIHRLPSNVEWRGERIDKALANADMLVVETADADDNARMARVFVRLATSPGHPPLDRRVKPEARGALSSLMHAGGFENADFATTETWAAALTLANVAAGDDGGRDGGVDGQLVSQAGAMPVVELEGTDTQLRIFDGLPEQDQRDLLASVVAEAGTGKARAGALSAYWMKGDMAAIAAETGQGMMDDAQLRAALLIDRNRRWASRIAALLRKGHHPFVAVGAAHMAGPDGLPADLAAHGWRVRRVQ